MDCGRIALRSRKIRASSRRLISEARVVAIESKRMLVWNAERRARLTRREADRELVRVLQAELQRTEARYSAEFAGDGVKTPSAKLRRAYGRLAEKGSNAVKFMTCLASRQPPNSRFDTAVRVQALEELVSRWREVEGAHPGPRPTP